MADEEIELDDFDDDVDEDLSFWSDRQKELVTAQVDYNLGTLRDLTKDKTIDLAPHYQRRFRWDTEKKSKLIESLLMNVPIPPIYLNEDKFGRYSIIDGKQRVSAVAGFLENEFPLTGLKIFSDLNELTFSKLPSQIQPIMRTRPTLRAIIVLKQSDPAIKHQVFQRLNTGGVPLNPQEIRNNVYSGPLNNAINKIGESVEFHKVLKIKNKSESKLYKEMRDSELVLRYMTFSENWRSFSGGVRAQMDDFMEQNKTSNKNKVVELSAKFSAALEKAVAVFGDHAFQRWQAEKGSWRNQVLASVYDAQMLGMQKFDINKLISKKNKIIQEFQSLFSDEAFLKSVNAATNTPSFLKYRVEKTERVISGIVK